MKYIYIYIETINIHKLSVWRDHHESVMDMSWISRVSASAGCPDTAAEQQNHRFQRVGFQPWSPMRGGPWCSKSMTTSGFLPFSPPIRWILYLELSSRILWNSMNFTVDLIGIHEIGLMQQFPGRRQAANLGTIKQGCSQQPSCIFGREIRANWVDKKS